MRETIAWCNDGGGCWCEHAIEPKATDETGARRFEMDVAGGGRVGLFYEQVDVADDRRLVREIADVRGVVVVVVGGCELDVAVGSRGQPFNEAIDFVVRGLLGDDGAVGAGEVIEADEECIGCGGCEHAERKSDD